MYPTLPTLWCIMLSDSFVVSELIGDNMLGADNSQPSLRDKEGSEIKDCRSDSTIERSAHSEWEFDEC